ncbi:hypothetical protein HK099_002589 [Clydaea vesicula]|uniref:BTB domain-containing protein n=1 Tax=Clydaea vesicula TaxID=447962 RepID=A0AAD5XWM9_9FUNG|nr:hypothetical protein HK099_002589 [Clydaea vesicula]
MDSMEDKDYLTVKVIYNDITQIMANISQSSNILSKALEIATSQTSTFSDVTFLLGKEQVEVNAIKFLLAIRSSVFNKLLLNGMTESYQDVVKLPEIQSPEAFKILIRYLQTGFINRSQLNIKICLEVAKLADYFDVSDLVDVIGELFLENSNVDEFLFWFEDAMEALAILRSEKFTSINSTALFFIVNNLTESSEQYELLKAVVAYNSKNKISTENLRKLIKLIDFDYLTGKEILILEHFGQIGFDLIEKLIMKRFNDLNLPALKTKKLLSQPFYFESPNGTSIHVSTESKTQTVLTYQPFFQGLHSWEVELEEFQSPFAIQVGIATGFVDRSLMIGEQTCGWALNSNGYLYHSSYNNFGYLGIGLYKQGDTLRFTLELLNDVRQLSISIKSFGQDQFTPSKVAFQNLPECNLYPGKYLKTKF